MRAELLKALPTTDILAADYSCDLLCCTTQIKFDDPG